MALPNLSGNGQGLNISNQQLAELIGMLAQQPQANPSSPQFNPTYFSRLMGLNQGSTQQQPTQSVQQQVALPPSQKTDYTVVRIVDDPATIGAQEVTMGMSNLFPSSDGERIYLKKWNNDGLIEPRVYVLQNEEQATSQVIEDPRFDEMEERIVRLEAVVAKLKKQQASKPSKSTSKPKPKPKPAPEPVVTSAVESDEEEEVYNG